MGKRITELGIPFRSLVLEDCKSPGTILGSVDTIPKRKIVIGIGLHGSENLARYPKYI